MYFEHSTKPIVNNVMKKILSFLILVCVLSGSSALATIKIINRPTELPLEGETPSGLVDLWLFGSELPALVDNDYFGNIETSPLSGSASYNDASLNGEVGLWYAEGNVVLGSDASYGRSIASGFAHFTIDDSQLSLHWDFDATTDQSDQGAPSWHAIVQDDESGEIQCWYSSVNYPAEGTETLVLIPDHVYRLYWDVDVGVWDEYGGYSKAILTLDLADIGLHVCVPDVLGMTVSEAEATLHSVSLVIGVVSYACSDTISAGLVMAQDPSAGTEVAPGSEVDLVISSGPDNGGGGMPIQLDIIPNDCANRIIIPRWAANRIRIPVAIIGSSAIDVTKVVRDSLRLEGVRPRRVTIRDISTGICDVKGPDGFADLIMRFSAADVIDAIGGVKNGETVTLKLTGELKIDSIVYSFEIEDSATFVFRGYRRWFPRRNWWFN